MTEINQNGEKWGKLKKMESWEEKINMNVTLFFMSPQTGKAGNATAFYIKNLSKIKVEFFFHAWIEHLEVLFAMNTRSGDDYIGIHTYCVYYSITYFMQNAVLRFMPKCRLHIPKWPFWP